MAKLSINGTEYTGEWVDPRDIGMYETPNGGWSANWDACPIDFASGMVAEDDEDMWQGVDRLPEGTLLAWECDNAPEGQEEITGLRIVRVIEN